MAKKTPARKNQKPLDKIQRNLGPYQKFFSRFIHSRFIEQISDVLEKTLARPSGLLVGGLVFLLTNVIILIICKYYGYEYNYFIGLISFPFGFVFGLVIELFSKLFNRK